MAIHICSERSVLNPLVEKLRKLVLRLINTSNKFCVTPTVGRDAHAKGTPGRYTRHREDMSLSERAEVELWNPLR